MLLFEEFVLELRESVNFVMNFFSEKQDSNKYMHT